MPEESMEVQPSEDQGNLPAMEETPSTPSEVQPEPAQAEPDAQPTPEPAPEPAAQPAEPTLYDLPDGRKVTADELYKEHTQNLLPEFTRRSQRLSEYESGKTPADPKTQPNNSQPENQNRYSDPNYIPGTYDEIIEEGKRRALEELDNRERRAVETRQQVESQVSQELEEVKKIDPTVNPEKLFAHAVKYGFSDLRVAHKNMLDMAELVKTTQKQTVDNVTKRSDPVSKPAQPSGTRPNRADFSSATDYYRAISNQSQ